MAGYIINYIQKTTGNDAKKPPSPAGSAFLVFTVAGSDSVLGLVAC